MRRFPLFSWSQAWTRLRTHSLKLCEVGRPSSTLSVGEKLFESFPPWSAQACWGRDGAGKLGNAAAAVRGFVARGADATRRPQLVGGTMRGFGRLRSPTGCGRAAGRAGQIRGRLGAARRAGEPGRRHLPEAPTGQVRRGRGCGSPSLWRKPPRPRSRGKGPGHAWRRPAFFV